MRQHKYKPSNIQAHYVTEHKKALNSDFFNQFKILYMDYSSVAMNYGPQCENQSWAPLHESVNEHKVRCRKRNN